MVRAVGAALLLVVLPLAGCSGSPSSAPPPTRSDAPAPSLGGPSPHPQAPPTTPMDHLEKPIARQLSERVEKQGLHLDYLDCPSWDGHVPGRLRCTGYFDGVTATVKVRLHELAGGSVSFDATLADGVIATERLVRQLRDQGYTDVDCGSVPAYPARVGERVVCRVTESGETTYVVATVENTSGAVTISDYR